MARSSWISDEQLKVIEKELSPLARPDGNLKRNLESTAGVVSGLLIKKLEEQIQGLPGWKDLDPVVMGSWARGELCPRSDLDCLLLGPEEKVKEFVGAAQAKGFKIRARVPANPMDWSEGVEPFDVLGILSAQPVTERAAEVLRQQQRQLFTKQKRRIWIRALRDERRTRHARYDSISNYLEPQLKYGPGGLRDLDQGFQILHLLPEIGEWDSHLLKVLRYYREYWLTLRLKLHFSGFSDQLAATEQESLSRWLGFAETKEFMKSVQAGLSRVNFYTDWLVEEGLHFLKERSRRRELKKFKNPNHVLLSLKRNPSVSMQFLVRRHMDDVFKKKNLRMYQGHLRKYFSVQMAEDFLTALFRSRVIEKYVPRLTRLVGYTQHDQYHRYTADAHIYQICREVLRCYASPKALGPLKKWADQLKRRDWDILLWAALYHDLGKGLKLGHEGLGKKWVLEDFQKFGHSKKLSDEVAWLVQYHLELSKAAFRKNPYSEETWRELYEMGLNKERLLRLAIFTALDIRATNPEAWNSWKAKLLAKLVEQMLHPSTFDYLKSWQGLSRNFSIETLKPLQPGLFAQLGAKTVEKDLKKIFLSKSRSVYLRSAGRGQVWIRFHEPQDRMGLLTEYVSQLFSLGCSIHQAYIHTLPELGVYDWFLVSSQRKIPVLEKLLLNQHQQPQIVPPKIQMLSVELISSSASEWVVSFRGLDQKGLLLAVTHELSQLGVSVRSAQVHTWGRQVEDIFHLAPGAAEARGLLDLLKEKITRREPPPIDRREFP